MFAPDPNTEQHTIDYQDGNYEMHVYVGDGIVNIDGKIKGAKHQGWGIALEPSEARALANALIKCAADAATPS